MGTTHVIPIIPYKMVTNLSECVTQAYYYHRGLHLTDFKLAFLAQDIANTQDRKSVV